MQSNLYWACQFDQWDAAQLMNCYIAAASISRMQNKTLMKHM